MNRNFFIRLTFAAHRVADVLPASPSQGGPEEQFSHEIKETANEILADLIILFDKGGIQQAKKHDLIAQILRQIDIFLVYLERAKKEGWSKPENFSLLETEYGKIRDLLAIFEGEKQTLKEAPKGEKKEEVSIREGELTNRQKRIVEFLKAKQKAQVWELQKVLPEVTKRTLRRDLDELLQKNLVERKGEWNAVSYELKV